MVLVTVASGESRLNRRVRKVRGFHRRHSLSVSPVASCAIVGEDLAPRTEHPVARSAPIPGALRFRRSGRRLLFLYGLRRQIDHIGFSIPLDQDRRGRSRDEPDPQALRQRKSFLPLGQGLPQRLARNSQLPSDFAIGSAMKSRQIDRYDDGSNGHCGHFGTQAVRLDRKVPIGPCSLAHVSSSLRLRQQVPRPHP